MHTVIGHYSNSKSVYKLNADENKTYYKSKYIGKDLLKALVYFYYPEEF